MEIAEFLLARFAEDEAVARAAIAPDAMYPWGDRSLPRMPVDTWPDNVRGYLGGPWGEHCARHDPARVLAECEAKRRIVATHSGAHFCYPECDMTWDDAADEWTVGYPCGTLRLLALPYADHPDYRDEWKP